MVRQPQVRHRRAGGALLGSGLRVLDVGCGAATYDAPSRALRHGPVRAEIDPAPLKLAQQRGWTMRAWPTPAQASPFGDGQFDLVATLDVIEHVQDDLATLRASARVLAPKGYLLVTVPAFMFLWGQNDV